MRRIVLVALAVAAMGSIAAPGVSGAQAPATLTLEEACIIFEGRPLAGVAITVSGVLPFSTVSVFDTFHEE
jgi:hypothetical protein